MWAHLICMYGSGGLTEATLSEPLKNGGPISSDRTGTLDDSVRNLPLLTSLLLELGYSAKHPSNEHLDLLDVLYCLWSKEILTSLFSNQHQINNSSVITESRP